jgi:uncharacterized protein
MMSVRWPRPIIVGGIGLSLGLWGLDSLQHSLGGVGDWLTLGAMAAGGGYWWYYRQQQQNPIALAPAKIDLQLIDESVRQVELILDRLRLEGGNAPDIATFSQQLTTAKSHLNRLDRRITVTGGKRVGKSSLINLLAADPVQTTYPLAYTETPALFTAGKDIDVNAEIARQQNLAADLVLFLVNGDLTATEYKYLAQLKESGQHTIVLFNQSDRYLPPERETIVQKLQSTLKGSIAPADILSGTTAPTTIKLRQVDADGSVSETTTTTPAEIDRLSRQLAACLSEQGEKLLWANTYRQVDGVRSGAKATLNQHRRDRAMPVIEQGQWIVAAAAFANPLPALDLLATAAVNVQTIVDLGAIYQQKFTLEQAQTAASALGGLMLKLGIVEVCTQAVTGILKTNAVTFVAGGLVQGLSAAYLTRLVGLTLVEYLEAQDLLAPEPARAWNLEQLGDIFQGVFQANQRIATLQSIVSQGIDRLVPVDKRSIAN